MIVDYQYHLTVPITVYQYRRYRTSISYLIGGTYLFGVLVPDELDLPEGAPADHFDQVEVVRLHPPLPNLLRYFHIYSSIGIKRERQKKNYLS